MLSRSRPGLLRLAQQTRPISSDSMRAVLESLPKASVKPKMDRAPNAYILFSNKKRAELSDDVSFKAKSSADKMKHLSATWKSLSTSDKAPFESETAAAKTKTAAANANKTAPEPAAFPIEIKSETSLKKVSKQLADAAVLAVLTDLQAGKPVTVTGVGSLKPKTDKDGKLTISFKAAKTKE